MRYYPILTVNTSVVPCSKPPLDTYTVMENSSNANLQEACFNVTEGHQFFRSGNDQPELSYKAVGDNLVRVAPAEGVQISCFRLSSILLNKHPSCSRGSRFETKHSAQRQRHGCTTRDIQSYSRKSIWISSSRPGPNPGRRKRLRIFSGRVLRLSNRQFLFSLNL